MSQPVASIVPVVWSVAAVVSAPLLVLTGVHNNAAWTGDARPKDRLRTDASEEAERTTRSAREMIFRGSSLM